MASFKAEALGKTTSRWRVASLAPLKFDVLVVWLIGCLEISAMLDLLGAFPRGPILLPGGPCLELDTLPWPRIESLPGYTNVFREFGCISIPGIGG